MAGFVPDGAAENDADTVALVLELQMAQTGARCPCLDADQDRRAPGP